MTTSRALAPAGTVQQRILLIRGERVIVDADRAHFHGVPTKRLNEPVRRNRARFPVDFRFRLTVARQTVRLKYILSSAFPFIFPDRRGPLC